MKKVLINAFLAVMVTATSCAFVKAPEKTSNDSFWSILTTKADKSPEITKTFEVGDFTGIKTEIACDIDYVESSEPSLVIKTGTRTMENLKVEVVNGVLIISARKNDFRPAELDIKASSSTISYLEIDGALDFEAEQGLNPDSLKIDVNGAADIEIEGLNTQKIDFEINGASDLELKRVCCNTINGEVNGAADITIKGKAEKTNIDINGAGDLDLKDLDCPDKTTIVNGISKKR